MTYITGGLYSQAVKCLMTADMMDTAHRLLTFLERNQLKLELDPATKQQLVDQTAKLMSDIEYKEGLGNIQDNNDGKNVINQEV